MEVGGWRGWNILDISNLLVKKNMGGFSVAGKAGVSVETPGAPSSRMSSMAAI